ncbi:hypothetical protein [Geothrix sp. PMB-07]|uniref:hypothetical protein n=1 Tax=Geothrix sp. PMB-07 TaxID=3068640 RepID=UPI002740F2F1|nr:hypothetical protein [Geothrix sp. PMB-07]WLT32081.1 hypothetical protein Q9293_01885 [Geothrix sp. PMB-07]
MRRRDVVSLCLIWGLVLAALAWALSTQFRWVQEAKPIQVQRPSAPEKGEGAEPPPASATGVIGTIDDDTRAALAKGLGGVPAEPPKVKPSGTKKGR